MFDSPITVDNKQLREKNTAATQKIYIITSSATIPT